MRLGQDVDRTGRLAPEAIERTRVALVDYAALIARTGARAGPDVRHVGQPRRRATGPSSSPMVHAVLGVEPEVVSGDEEAALSLRRRHRRAARRGARTCPGRCW